MTEPPTLSEEALVAEQQALLAQQAEQNSAAEQNAEQATAEHGSDLEDSMTATQTIPMSDNPLKDLETLSVHQIAQALGSEQSRTTAMLLANLPAKLTGDILNLLKAEYQKLVMKELTKEQHAPAILVDRIARATFLRARQFSAEPPDTRNHADRVAEVLRSVPKAGRKNMLAAIEEQDPDLAKSLLTRIYRFDDITALNKAVVQRVLGEVDSANLTTALFGADESVKDAIFANLSKRARQTIEEEMQFMTNVSETRILQARDAIAEVIAKIDMESES
jgi:flagellar motor switch protein FliG